MRIIKKLFFYLLCLCVVFFVWQFYSVRKEKKQLPALLTASVKQGDIAQYIQATGTISARKKVNIGAQISGEISALNVKIGQKLKQGSLIATIDSRTQQNAYQNALAQVAGREAALSAAQFNVSMAKTREARQQSLVKRGAAAKESLESASSALIQAESELVQAESQLKQSKFHLETAKINLGYTKVSAPIDGTILAVFVEQGQSVNAQSSIPTIASIADLSEMVVKVEIAESDISKVKAGMPATLTLFDKHIPPYEGKLTRIDPAPLYISDNLPNSSKTTYYYGYMQLPNPEGMYRIGMTANLKILVAEAHNALIMPLSAIQIGKDAQEEVIVVDENGEQERRKVKLGIQNGQEVEVLSGVKLGEQVVLGEAKARKKSKDPEDDAELTEWQ